jgi:cofilin
MKLKKNSKYIVFKLSDDLKEVVVDKQSSDTNYDIFLADLPTVILLFEHSSS